MKKIVSVIFLTLFIIAIVLINFKPKYFDVNLTTSREGFYFDTVINITVYGENEKTANTAIDECFNAAQIYESYFSSTIADSDINKINNNAPNAVKVHDETVYVIKKSIDYSNLSNGRFDVTMGNVIKLWDFNQHVIPSESELDKYIKDVDYNNIKIDDKNVKIYLENNNSSIDLGGIAKGFIADKMKEILIENNIKSAIINLGGNVNILGSKPDGSDFTVGIQNPFEENTSSILNIKASDISIVTSGTYQRSFKKSGKLYHHILDKSTGMPVNNGLVSVTIITESSIDADALSTTVFLLGEEKGLALLNSMDNTEGIFIYDDKRTTVYTPGMDKYL